MLSLVILECECMLLCLCLILSENAGRYAESGINANKERHRFPPLLFLPHIPVHFSICFLVFQGQSSDINRNVPTPCSPGHLGMSQNVGTPDPIPPACMEWAQVS